jgi:hypothetical protein
MMETLDSAVSPELKGVIGVIAVFILIIHIFKSIALTYKKMKS